MLSGVDFVVDGEAVDVSEAFTYKGMMYSGIPNMAQTFGYINASWTLRADLTSEYICRLLNHMDENGAKIATPTLREEDAGMEPRPWITDFPAGYMMRSMHLFPKQGEGPGATRRTLRLTKRWCGMHRSRTALCSSATRQSLSRRSRRWKKRRPDHTAFAGTVSA